MKKTFLSRLTATAALTLIAVQAFAQLPINPRSQLPQNFQVVKQAEYNQMPIQEVTFPDFYDVEVTKYYHEDAIKLEPQLAYPVWPSTPVVRPTPCGNGDFEAGLLTSEWSGAYGNIGGTLASGIVGGAINLATSRQTLVTAGTDPTVMTINTVAPSGGSTRAVRIGNTATGAGMELLSKTFTVTSATSIINFWYAVVMEDPGHAPTQQPYFEVKVLESGVAQTGVVDLGGGRSKLVSDAADPFFRSHNNGAIAYRDWSCASINLTKLIGKTVTIQFINADCSAGAHFGYTYIDNFCGTCADGSYNLSYAKSDCGAKSTICFDYVLPKTGTTYGTLKINLNIYQNGTLLTTLTSPVLTSTTTVNGSYCFSFDPTTIPGIDLTLGGFDYTAVGNFTLSGFALSPFYLFLPPDGRVPDKNNDCSFVVQKQCCPGTNLVVNGGFEAGNTGFTSGYTYQALVAAGSVSTGRYGILTDAQALAVSPTWNTNCATYNKHMVVNGSTCAGMTRLVWSQTIAVKPGTTYKFCGDFKNLPQCGFDVVPKVDVRITQASGQTVSLTDGVSGSISVPNASCNWVSLERAVTIPAGLTAVTISIYLNEPTIGDGNDLALDNLAFIALPNVPTSQVSFGVTPYNITASTYNMSATASVALPAGCNHYWEVAELDPNNAYNVIPGTLMVNPAWQTLSTTTFNGYNSTTPGTFYLNKTYRFVYGRSCTCQGISKRYYIYGPMANKASGSRSGDANSGPQLIGSGVLTEETVMLPTGAKTLVTTSFNIFPNPTDNKVTIEKSATDADYEVKVINSFGQLVKTISMKATDIKAEISLAEFASGSYMINIISSKGGLVHSEKVTKL